MKLRAIFFSILTLFVGFLSTQTFAEGHSDAEPMQVTVSILPQKYFLNEIGGKYVKVNVMVPPGAEPADYEPKPSQMTELSKSKLYFSIGVPFEKSWLNRFQGANPDMKIIKTEQGIEKMPLAFDDEGNRIPTSKGLMDPHVWLSPALVRIQAMNIRDALSDADPSHKEYYRQNYMKFAKKINAIDEQLVNIMSGIPASETSFITFHPAWGYFAADYGLHQLPIQVEGKEADMKHLQKLIDYAKKENIKVIFMEPQFSKKQAKVIANAIGGKVIAIDPLAEDWGKNLVSIAETFKATMK